VTITSSKRSAVRAGTLAALTSAPLLAASSAFASDFQGEDAGPRLSALQTVGIFVGIPVGLFVLITVLVLLPGWIRGDRNRNEIGWDSKSAARAKSAPKDQTGEGTSEEVKAGASSSGTGGASGSW
jgi:uncharacterized membrane protein YgcG